MKKIFALAVAGLMAVAAKADYSSTYFYWNVGETDSSISGFSYATLLYSVAGSGSWTEAGVGNLTYGDKPATMVGGNNDGTTASVFGNLGDATLDNTYSFMAAVYNDSGDKIGESEAVAYNALTMFDYIYTDMGKTPTSSYAFSVAAVPEPTSGLLLLLGVAGLALRRKRGRDVPVASGMSSDNARGRDVPVASGISSDNARGRDVLVASI